MGPCLADGSLSTVFGVLAETIGGVSGDGRRAPPAFCLEFALHKDVFDVARVCFQVFSFWNNPIPSRGPPKVKIIANVMTRLLTWGPCLLHPNSSQFAEGAPKQGGAPGTLGLRIQAVLQRRGVLQAGPLVLCNSAAPPATETRREMTTADACRGILSATCVCSPRFQQPQSRAAN